jgi:nucleotide-binding universal stress UspA family protein
VASAAFAAIFVTLVLSGFHQPAPHGLPVGIAGPAAVAGQVERALNGAAPGAYSFRGYPSAAAATAGIAQRQVDGAVVASGGGLRLLVAQAGGNGPEQALIGTFTAVAARSGQHLTVVDVVPARASDSQGLSSWFTVLGVLIPSLAAGPASAMAFGRARRGWAVAAPVAAAAVTGLAAAGIADGIAGLGHYPAIAGIVALFSLAVSAPAAALARTWPPLAALALLAFVIAGIPASGGAPNLASFTPGFLRALYPVLPLGIAASAIRGVVYFGGQATTQYLWTLAGWALAGVTGLVLATAFRHHAPVPQPAPPPAAAAGTAAGTGTGTGPAAVLPARAPAPRAPDPGAARPVTLVAGFDDSEPARRALAWAAGLVAARHGTLHVIYADHALIDSDLSGFARAEMDQARDSRAAAVAAAAAEIAAAAGIQHAFERRQEPPADAILHAASLHDIAGPATTPVIITGRSRHAARHVIGSVPVRLLHHSPYPVLTIA